MFINKYSVTVKDDFFDVELTGDFFAPDENDAMAQAADHYADSLGTDIDAIEIVNCKLIG